MMMALGSEDLRETLLAEWRVMMWDPKSEGSTADLKELVSVETKVGSWVEWTDNSTGERRVSMKVVAMGKMTAAY